MGAATEIPHPFDPLTLSEIEIAISTVKKAHGEVKFNVVALQEPRKAEMTAWLEAPETAPRPKRIADVVAIAPGGKVYDGLVALDEPKIIEWVEAVGQQPIVSDPILPNAKSHILIPFSDHNGGAPIRRAHRPQRPQGHRTVRH